MKKNEYEVEMSRLLDRGADVRACVGRLVESWRYDLSGRKVGEAYQKDDDAGYTTDLDLACFLVALADRRAAINLPEYRSRRAATRTTGEVVLSKENRHGRIIGVTSNADTFNFNVLIEDANVMTASETGRPRNFMLQDLDGTWHDGWRSIEFLANTPAEEKLFSNTNSVEFKYFIHPNRWTSFYSRAYVLAKVAELRLQDQQRFLKAEIKRIKDVLGVPPTEWPKTEKVGDEEKITVTAFNAEVDGVEIAGTYAGYPDTQDGLVAAQDLNHRVGEFLRTLRFHIRATEFAFWSQVVVRDLGNVEQVLGWLQVGTAALQKPAWCGADWKTGYRESPRAKTYWATLERDGMPRLRWRCWLKTERVAAE